MPIFYRPPAEIDDFSRRPALAEQLRQSWHNYIGGTISRRDGNLFYDAANDPAPGTVATRVPVPWNGFPRSIWQWFNADTDPAGADKAFATAETLAPEVTVFKSSDRQPVELFARQQDEYCEWHAHRQGGRITRITFTCEGPEYFETLAEADPSLVGDLYREHVDTSVRDSDLIWAEDMVDEGGNLVFRAGSYNRLNDWNTRAGAMHLTHGANTLGAEINLAADASRIYPVNPTPPNTFPLRLICCAAFGGVNRSSDPTIGAGVNGLARSGKSVALANPVGLYITEIAIDGLRSPNGTSIGSGALRIRRASPDGSLILRAEVAPPQGANYTLDECTFEGRPVTGGGVIARRITMALFGLAKTIPGRTPRNENCRAKCCQHPAGASFSAPVRMNQNCADLTEEFWRAQGPFVPGPEMGLVKAPALSASEIAAKKSGRSWATDFMSAARISAPRSLRPPGPVGALLAAASDVELGDAAGAPAEPVLAADEIQGNIWPGFNTEQMGLLGVRIIPGEEKNAQLWLRDLAPLVTTLGDAWHAREVRRAVAKATGVAPPRPAIFLNVAFSYDALSLLGLSNSKLAPGPFRSGMAMANLQDPVDAAGVPVGWKVGATAQTTPHILLIVGADDTEALNDAVNILKSRTGPGSGLEFFYEDIGHRLPEEREHFGFRDGISQPGLRGRLNDHPESFVTRRSMDSSDPLAERFAKPGQPLLWPGQFIFGYPSQNETSEGPGPDAIPPEPWMRNGSFLVFRRLRQDVRAFREFCARQAEAVSGQLGRPVTTDEIQAWIVGRWPDGSALVRCPDAPCSPADSEAALNHFDYADTVPDTTVHETSGSAIVTGAPGDALGMRCPHFAHVRKVNLRDKPTDVRPSSFFRIIRRGIPYGSPWTEGETGTPDRGLFFIAYMRDIEQFMTLSAVWMNQQSSPEGPFGHDLLVGQRIGSRNANRTFADGGTAHLQASPNETWVIPTGGGFFFAPSRSTLASLAHEPTPD